MELFFGFFYGFSLSFFFSFYFYCALIYNLCSDCWVWWLHRDLLRRNWIGWVGFRRVEVGYWGRGGGWLVGWVGGIWLGTLNCNGKI
ncbi:hypothetical protein DFH27DRAFT_226425 [Peziza echinospora]|nr:hypothetical protein DFH27DRAFT_226425 [Peziza echinospora]